jgi:hypothetical protein
MKLLSIQKRKSGNTHKINDLHSWNNISLISGMDVDVFDVSSQRFSDKITQLTPIVPIIPTWQHLFLCRDHIRATIFS